MSNKKKQQREFSETEAKRKIRKLTIRNNKLEREVEALKAEIEILQGKGEKFHGSNKYQALLRKRSDSETMYSKRSYFSFIWSHFTHTTLFNGYKRILNYIRKYTFITTTLQILTFLLAFVEAAILIVISTSAFIAALISTLLASHTLLFLGLFTRKKHLRLDKKILDGKNAVIFFPPKERAFEEDSYFRYMVSELAEKENTVVVIVSPFLVKSDGLFEIKKSYRSSRQDKDNVLLVRKNYYFALKSKVIDKVCSSTTEIY